MANQILGLRVPFIEAKLDGKRNVVVFPDKTGNVYIFGGVMPKQVQSRSTRDQYLLDKKILPVGKIVLNDGMLDIEGVNGEAVIKALAKWPVAYLMAHGFLSKDLGLAYVATALVSRGGGTISEDQAKAVTQKLYQGMELAATQVTSDFMLSGSVTKVDDAETMSYVVSGKPVSPQVVPVEATTV